ncbi:hypothetical protein C8Q73DRAFT_669146 [Cubamyces lactineus]|nr:hypothetical protein C8Q73DRAFT_669146 [Cubamyces lactineus]
MIIDNAPTMMYNPPTTMYNTPTTMYNTPTNIDNPVIIIPTTMYNAPTTMYNAPTMMYNTPTTMYNTPTTMYNTPTTMYNTPTNIDNPVIIIPTTMYNAPTTMYNTPTNIDNPVIIIPTTMYNAPTTMYNAPTTMYNTPTNIDNPVIIIPTTMYNAPTTMYNTPTNIDNPVIIIPTMMYNAPTTMYNTPTNIDNPVIIIPTWANCHSGRCTIPPRTSTTQLLSSLRGPIAGNCTKRSRTQCPRMRDVCEPDTRHVPAARGPRTRRERWRVMGATAEFERLKNLGGTLASSPVITVHYVFVIYRAYGDAKWSRGSGGCCHMIRRAPAASRYPLDAQSQISVGCLGTDINLGVAESYSKPAKVSEDGATSFASHPQADRDVLERGTLASLAVHLVHSHGDAHGAGPESEQRAIAAVSPLLSAAVSSTPLPVATSRNSSHVRGTLCTHLEHSRLRSWTPVDLHSPPPALADVLCPATDRIGRRKQCGMAPYGARGRAEPIGGCGEVAWRAGPAMRPGGLAKT